MNTAIHLSDSISALWVLVVAMVLSLADIPGATQTSGFDLELNVPCGLESQVAGMELSGKSFGEQLDVMTEGMSRVVETLLTYVTMVVDYVVVFVSLVSELIFWISSLV